MVIDWQKEVEKQKDELLHHTCELLRIKSVLDEKTTSDLMPFGQGIDEALQYMLELGKKNQFKVKNIDGYAGSIMYGEGSESLGVLAHLDVVPANEEEWTSPPFAAQIRDERIYARGAIDNKGPAMAAFYALLLLQKLNVPLRKEIQLIFGTDEESDWRCVDHYFKKEKMPTIGFVPDADFPIIYAEKGIADVSFRWSSANQCELGQAISLISLTSGERLNMVPNKAVAKLFGNYAQMAKIKSRFIELFAQSEYATEAELRDGTLTLTIKGKAAHGSTPEKGVNASFPLVQFLSDLPIQRTAIDFLSFIKKYVIDDIKGKELMIAAEDEVSGPLTVNAGIINYILGEKAEVSLNIRYPVTTKGEQYFQMLKNIADKHHSTFTVLDHMEPLYVNKDHELIATLQQVYERQTGEKAELLTTGGGTYARALQTGVAFGPLFPDREDMAHQKDEYIEIVDLLKATALYAEAMYELAK